MPQISAEVGAFASPLVASPLVKGGRYLGLSFILGPGSSALALVIFSLFCWPLLCWFVFRQRLPLFSKALIVVGSCEEMPADIILLRILNGSFDLK